MASTNNRLSAALPPTWPSRPGKKFLIRSHWSSRNPKRCMGRPGQRREPAVEYGEIPRQGREDGQLVGREVVQNRVRMGHVLALLKVAPDEALHDGRDGAVGARAVELQVHVGIMMARVGVELALKFGLRRHLHAC